MRFCSFISNEVTASSFTTATTRSSMTGAFDAGRGAGAAGRTGRGCSWMPEPGAVMTPDGGGRRPAGACARACAARSAASAAADRVRKIVGVMRVPRATSGEGVGPPGA